VHPDDSAPPRGGEERQAPPTRATDPISVPVVAREVAPPVLLTLDSSSFAWRQLARAPPLFALHCSRLN
jgi:hypothetical protein